MADINALIAQGIRPVEIQDPLARAAKFATLQGAQQEQQLNALKMQEYQRGVEEQNALRDLLRSGVDLSSPEGQRRVLTTSPTAGQALIKGRVEAQKTETETQVRQSQLINEGLKRSQDLLNQINPNDPNAPAQYMAWHEANHKDPVLGPWLASRGVTADQSRARIMDAINRGPESFSELLMQSQLGTAKMREMMVPKPERQELGDRVDVIDMNPNSPTFRKVLQSLPKGAAPRQSQLLTPPEEQQRVRIALAGRAPQQPPAPTLATIQNPANPAEMIVVDARTGRTIGGAGKAAPVAAAEAKREEGASQARDILDTLRAAYDTLDVARAVPSEQRNVISNALSYVSGTGVGQIAGRVAGTKEQTQRDIIQSARNNLLNAVKTATGMSAQQLNSNVEFRSWLEALTDPTRTIEANRAIIDNMEKFIASGGTYSTRSRSGKVAPAAPAAGRAQPAPAGGGGAAGDWSVVR